MSGIAVLVTNVAPSPVGGSQLQASAWAHHLSARHEVTVITRRDPPDVPLREERDGYTLLRILRWSAVPKAVPAQLFPRSMRGTGITRFLRGAQSEVRLAREARALRRSFAVLERKPDFLLCFNTFPLGALGIRVGCQLDIPTVVWIRGQENYLLGTAGEIRRRSRRVWEKAAGVLVQSEIASRELLAVLAAASPSAASIVADKLAVVENGVELPSVTDYRPGGPVLSVGRLMPDKRMDVVIDACARLGHPLVIAGAGPQRTALQEQADRLGADVRFTGFIDGEALAALYRQASVLVLASETEGMPNAVLEAMAQARPVVATPVGGVPGLIDDGVNGLLLGRSDPEELVSALSLIATKPQWARRLGLAARATVEEFAWDAVIPKLEATLNRWRGN